ncbi:MAG: SagB/ThcOx family dehydrogenase [Planctomycetes bacterium]|nr:SagB/ThcOx family dehydrogenase [Planctomycetota bacterium]
MASSGRDGLPIGDSYQQATKYHRGRGARAEAGKARPAEGTEALPPPQTQGGAGLWSVVQARRSVRDFRRAPLSRQQLSQLLWATQGITASAHGQAFRAAPSAGACYPLDTYLVANRVEGLEAGLYRYDAESVALARLRLGDLSGAIAAACLDQEMAAEAAVVFAWVAVPARSKQRYRERAYRYVYLDGGHIGENLHLAATALGLGCCAIGAFFDDEVNALLGVDGLDETAVYLSVVGVPA